MERQQTQTKQSPEVGPTVNTINRRSAADFSNCIIQAPHQETMREAPQVSHFGSMITPKKGSNQPVQNMRLQDSSCRPSIQPVVTNFLCGLSSMEQQNSTAIVGNLQKSFSHHTLNASRNNLVDSTNTGPESTEKCSKLREILEKLPMLRKVSDGSQNGRRESNELGAASSQSSGSNRQAERQDVNSSPRIQMSLNRAMFD